MTRQTARRLMGSIAFMLATTCATLAQACCHRSATQVEEQTFLQNVPITARDKAFASVGEGEHVYRFVVRDARQPSRPWRRAAYQVTTREGVKWEGGPDAHQGITDERGRTAIFRSKSSLAPEAWMVLPLQGQGKMGMSFRLVDQSEQGVADHPYLIDAERGHVYCGRSLPGGHTARVRTPQETSLRLYTNLDESECLRLEAALNPVMDDVNPQRQIKALQRLISQGWRPPSQERLNNKLMDVLLAHGGEVDIRDLVSKWMAEPGITRQKMAERLNSAGYGLLDQKTPRLVGLAESLLAQGRDLDPTPAIIDSHAWALHAQGRHEDALAELDAALEGFEQTCTEDEERMYQETLAHRAEVLTDMGRSDEAFEVWVRAHRLNQQATWASSVRRWSDVREPVQQETRRRELDGVPAPRGCADTRDQRFLSGELAMPNALKRGLPPLP